MVLWRRFHEPERRSIVTQLEPGVTVRMYSVTVIPSAGKLRSTGLVLVASRLSTAPILLMEVVHLLPQVISLTHLQRTSGPCTVWLEIYDTRPDGR